MKTSKSMIRGLLTGFIGLFAVTFSHAQSYMAVNGQGADYSTSHYYIDESAGETDSVLVEFWPNDGSVETAEVWSNLNNRDLATLDAIDPDTVNAGDVSYYTGHTMSQNGSGGYHIVLPIEKCGAYRMTCRYKVFGDPEWRWSGVRDAGVVITDVATRDLIMMEIQVNSVDATGDTAETRSTFADLHDDTRFNLDYVQSLGINTLWLMPFHPIGSLSDGNHGEIGSPYSIKNMWKVAEHMGADGTREGAMAEFKAFMAEAESKGVNILFDTIFNHTAKDAEIERDPTNPAFVAPNPLAEIRNLRTSWYSRYTGDGTCLWGADTGGSPPYEYWAPAENASQVGPAPADRHDFGKWCDASDLFWGTYSALGAPQNEDDSLWVASAEVKEMTEYFSYFTEYWLNETGYAIDGFRCDFAQGVPPEAWEYMINKAKSLKPELAFMAESLDGGAVSIRAGRHFDIINESWVWGMLGNGNTSSGIRGIVDSRKEDYGYAGVLRGLINHDQSAPADKWYTMSRYAVGCALDGSPQMFMGQELGYVDHWGFSRFREEFGRFIPDIRNYYNMETLWNDQSWDHNALWARYAEANHGRQRSEALRLANQYYLDQQGGGVNENIFAVMKYTVFGSAVADQEVVLAFVNLDPFANNAGVFNVDVPAVGLSPNKYYNVRNLSSSTPEVLLWSEARSGADIAANGIYVGFSGNVYDEGAVTQFLKMEEVESAPNPVVWVGNSANWPVQGDVDSTDDVWIDTQSYPQGAAAQVKVFVSVDGGAFVEHTMNHNGFVGNNDAWNLNLGTFAANSSIAYYIETVDSEGTILADTNGGANYSVSVNGGGGGGDPVQWFGNTYNWPSQGQIDAGETLWVNIDTYPMGAAQTVKVYYSINGGAWANITMSLGGPVGNNDHWYVPVGTFSSGDHVQYAIEIIDGTSASQWDNNGGGDFHADVN